MSKNTGPCFEFTMNQEGANIEFVFLPGNVSKVVFSDTVSAIKAAFENGYGISSSDYIRSVDLNDGTKSIAIFQTKMLVVLKMILSGSAYRDFRIKVTGKNKNGETKEVVVNNPVDALNAAEVIPYFNKRNNDMTTRRRK